MTPDVCSLLDDLDSDDPHVRRDAARALGERAERAAVPALIASLKRKSLDGVPESAPEHTSRAAAAVALGRIGDPRALEPLLEALSDSFNLGTAASTALGRLKPPPLDELIAATRDENPWRRARACMALGETGDRSAFDAMVVLLRDPSSDVRRAAANAFDKLRDPRAVGPLIELLLDHRSSTFVRGFAAMALGSLKDPVAVEPLLANLDSEDANMRRAVARALCRIDDPRSRERLDRMASSDPDKTVRDVVARYRSPKPGQRPH